MKRNDIKILQDALLRAPNNIALRLSYALKLFKMKEHDESEKNYQQVLKLDPDNIKAKQGLIELYFLKGNYSAVIVIAEELATRGITTEKIMELQTKSLLKQNSVKEAQELYTKILAANPFYFDEELDSVLENKDEFLPSAQKGSEAFPNNDDFDDFEDFDDFNIHEFLSNPEQYMLPKKEPGFQAVIGQEYLKDEIFRKYIYFDLEEEITKKFDIKPNGTLLLYGPPGCGKTHLVSYIPYELDIDVLNFDLNHIPNEQLLIREFALPFNFNLARINVSSTLFMDNLDLWIGNKNAKSTEKSNTLVQLYNELDTIYNENHSIFVLAATNAVWDLDLSLMRYGRLDHQVFVTPPSEYDRALFFAHKFENFGLKISSFDELVSKSEFFSFADLERLFNDAVKIHLEDSLSSNKKKIQQLEVKTVLDVLNKSRSSIKYWFELFKQESNDIFKRSEIYDNVMTYIVENKL